MTDSTNQPDSDVLSDAIDTLNAGGAVFFRGSLAPPWQVSIPGSEQVLELMGRPKGVDTVLVFHAVLEGSPTLQLGSQGGALRLRAGDLVLLNLEEHHRLGEGQGGACLTMEGIVGGHDLRRPLVFDAGPDADAVKLICGGFFLRNTALHPLIAGLPPVCRVRGGGGFDAVTVLLTLLAQESESSRQGSLAVMRRLADLLLVELLRAVIDQGSAGSWLGALRDPVLRRALGAVHANPATDWSVPALARVAGMSASGLTLRFRETLGLSPARYVATWRMHVATTLLQQPELSIAEVAERVGYGSAEAFSRTFSRTLGESPGRWRDQRTRSTKG